MHKMFVFRRLKRVSFVTKWNNAAGDWQNLATEIERPRYLALAEILNSPRINKVLDIGAGEAHLKQVLKEDIFYVGVEPSLTACSRACSQANAVMLHSTAEDTFLGSSNWDAVVFNESIYYCDDPLALLDKARQSLRPGGKIIVSIFQKTPTWRERITARMTNQKATQLVRAYLAKNASYTERLIEDRWLLFFGEFKPESHSRPN